MLVPYSIRKVRYSLLLTCGLLGITTMAHAALDSSEPDYELKLLGKYIFFDKISQPSRMSCATCHDPDTGGTGSVSGVNLHQVVVTGADPHARGNLKPPTNAYASFIEPFHECAGPFRIDGVGYCGGNFWNGRAEGLDTPLLPGATKHIGNEVFQTAPFTDPIWNYALYFGGTSDQALNPMPNQAEQNIERKEVCEQVAGSKYASLYEQAWGEEIDCSDALAPVTGTDVLTETEFDISFKRMMLAVGAWQSSSDLNSFSSKRDSALRQELACNDPALADYFDASICADEDYVNSPGEFPLVGFTDEENLGHDLFYNTLLNNSRPDLPVTNCALCHLSEADEAGGTGLLERYTDDGYHNIGIPVNSELSADPDPGLAGHAQQINPSTAGGFKTPTLRNVDKRKGNGFIKAYGHNGWFKSLEGIVNFYNTAKVKPRCEDVIPDLAPFTEKVAQANNCWPQPEWSATTTPAFILGAMGMTPEQEAAVVAYLKTLTDSETPTAPEPYQAKKSK